ncbi:cystathionine gamma-synthase [Multifurca ochricompacta]|uniref:Cystathionine gamma-synthase n=1 Tax=Multifurca ochricompacta TaxID=376703 RepID=A0AAD4MC49_9AGAM|nr:cystathionine gamma-synthase [Multifurca ochricompacta]
MSPASKDPPCGCGFGTDLLHADDGFHGPEVSPSISVSTTFRQTEVPELAAGQLLEHPELGRDIRGHMYSRISQDVRSRVEQVLSKVNGGYAITYGSGLAAVYAALTLLRPRGIAIAGGYFGVHHVIQTYGRDRGLKVVDLDDNFDEVDICWVETPLNPTGEVRNLQHYADKAGLHLRIHSCGGRLVVDATFAPPPLQFPFKWGADIVMHSATKYFGGHSDLLGGVLVVKTLEEWGKLWMDRIALGGVMGSLESWLLLRSLRTLHLRIPRQSSNATVLAQWLNRIASTPKGQSFDGVAGGMIKKVWHSSLQSEDVSGWSPSQQMEGGHSPTFAILLESSKVASSLPLSLQYFIPATSLGGVESLIEQRVRSSPGEDPRLVRISVGIEDISDLKQDIRNALRNLNRVSSILYFFVFQPWHLIHSL